MATDRAGGARRPDDLAFACHACGVRFVDRAAGPGTCPRCGAIGGHERLGRP